MRMGLEMRMSQQLIMTPQLQQAIKLLQLSRLELEELIDQNLIENPTLEVEPVEEDEEKKEETNEERTEAKDLIDEQSQLSVDDEWQNYIESGAGVMQDVRSRLNDSDDMSNPLEATISRSASLMDHLLWQLDISKFDENEHEIAEYLIGNIDDEGYLAISLRGLLASTPKLLELVNRCLEENEIEPLVDEKSVSMFDLEHESRSQIVEKKKGRKKKAPVLDEEEEVEESPEEPDVSNDQCGILERVLRRIQQFDPPGVATRTLQECLINQLKILNLSDSIAMRILQENMQFLEQKDLKKIARLQKADIQEVVKAYQLITELEPKPGRPFGGEVTQYVIPDVFIYKRGAEYVVNMNQDSIPRLRINPFYQKMISSKKEETSQEKKGNGESEQNMTFQYIQEKIKSGDWLMKSIEQRQKTIFRVAKSILKFQHEFFEKGIDYLKPLVLKDVAEDIDVHESTVSRITTNKYVYTPQGIFELKYFFTSGIDQGDGDIISSKKIKDYIKKLIETEDKKKPYTDLQIKTQLLDDAGIKVARRTVAKYREAMNILPSNKRKKLY
ncbi:MAG: RNA polymerase factor sigma-54 [Proteobacteria bacterium]|nr:RNA polymerase factor sigma-54 [Pseudomonadota bacterium]